MLCKAVPTTEEALTARLLQSTMQALELSASTSAKSSVSTPR